jgi:hypothetical protein
VTSPPAARRGRESVGAEPDWFVRRRRQRLSLDTESMLSGSSEYLESNNTPLLKIYVLLSKVKHFKLKKI